MSLDKLYMLAVNQIFNTKMKPLVLEQMRKAQAPGNKKEIQKVAVTVMTYIRSIKNQEWAVATAHKITQELPSGLTPACDESVLFGFQMHSYVACRL